MDFGVCFPLLEKDTNSDRASSFQFDDRVTAIPPVHTGVTLVHMMKMSQVDHSHF